MKLHPSFPQAIQECSNKIRDFSSLVHTEKWQGMEISSKPEMATYEVLNHSFQAMMGSEDLDFYADAIRPNLPWADDHFLERVGGQPINPGVQWANWPYNRSADRFRTEGNQQFSHTYMERFWPKFAGHTPDGRIDDLDQSIHTQNMGYRYRIGDLEDVAKQIAMEPQTRQAFIPLWFPEDTGVLHGGRVPCTLGYHFIRRGDHLHIVYYLRSCDFVRHFRDDVYLAVRLLLWILNRARQLNPDAWNNVRPGIYTMHMTSLHIFFNDYRALYKRER